MAIPTTRTILVVAVSVAFVARSHGFVAPSIVTPPATTAFQSSLSLYMGLLDDLQLIFSEEGKKNRAAYEARQRAEQEEAQREILERRRDPNKMQAYEQEVAEKRSRLQEEREVWDFQNKVEKGYDPITEWKRLREEGKITVGSDLERDPESSRLGSEGLVDVRVDERLPYIDQGYVDESADLMGGFLKMFGGGSTKKVDGKNGQK